MAQYVLVGGAWIGGWAWQRVARPLRARGHDVYPATLTGLGERAHLARPDVDLETHVTDVVNIMTYEDLTDVVLVGHSYGAVPVTAVADRIGDRLAKLVYVDSAPLENGESMLDFYPPEVVAEHRQQVAELGDGWKLPPPPFDQLPMSPTFEGLTDADRALMAAKAVVQPFGTYEQPLRLSNGSTANYERVIVACNDFRIIMGSGLPRFAQFNDPVWRRYDLATGHWPMLSMPNELVEILHGLAAE